MGHGGLCPLKTPQTPQGEGRARHGEGRLTGQAPQTRGPWGLWGDGQPLRAAASHLSPQPFLPSASASTGGPEGRERRRLPPPQHPGGTAAPHRPPRTGLSCPPVPLPSPVPSPEPGAAAAAVLPGAGRGRAAPGGGTALPPAPRRRRRRRRRGSR